MFGTKRSKQMTAAQAANYWANQHQAQLAMLSTGQAALTGWVTTGSTTSTTPTVGNGVIAQGQFYSSQGTLAGGISTLVRDTLRLLGDVTIVDGEPCKISLPDGSVLNVAADGSFTINDKEAKVTYRANRVREFNPFLNASDKVEAFITFCKIVGVRQGEFMDLPIKHFIAWLIIEAARADGEVEPELTLALDLRKIITQPRCRCGRFLSRRLAARKIAFCRPMCLERELEAA